MVEFNREFIKSDPEVLGLLWKRIIEIHKPAPHDEKELIAKRHIKNFCINSRYFMHFGNPGTIYIHYDTRSWYQDGKAVVKIMAIGVYDDEQEYKLARRKALHGSISADIPKHELN